MAASSSPSAPALVDAAGLHVRMSRGLGEAQHRGEAGVAALEQRAPMRARLAQEQARATALSAPAKRRGRIAPSGRRPQGRACRATARRIAARARRRRHTVRRRRRRRRRKASRGTGSGSARRAFRTARAESAMPPRLAAISRIEQSITQPLPLRPAAKTAATTPKARPSAPPPSPRTVGGTIGALTVAGGERQDSAERQIVEVVARDLRERTVLPPAGHAAIDQSRIALGAFRGTEPKTLHNAWPIALDQRVGRLDQRQRFLDRFGTLQIEGDNPFSPPQRTLGRAAGPDRRAGPCWGGRLRQPQRRDRRACGRRADLARSPRTRSTFKPSKRTHHATTPRARLYTAARLRTEPAASSIAPGTAPSAPAATLRPPRAR